MQASHPRYHWMARLLHALLGVALVGLFAVGLYMADLPFSPDRLKLYNWHKWAGVTILTLSFVRLMWRLTHRPPALPAAIEQAMPAWQRFAHHATHLGLYVLFFAVPLAGWAYSSAAGFPIVPFGLFQLPDFVPVSEGLADFMKPVHKYAAYSLAALVVLHVAGALKHRFVDRDGLLQRMAFGNA
ncbi:cytochrome b [Hydrogenophaga sp. PAMC20947]|uniref:cytochrome b n=1 Tax=Hydrogenophaga sp. PAMC20947 TaxID=2565558 RepID=UPI00109DF982|nr:cytochrome b [Hydrogenophaga sp. PAMC20947]QCB47573.1 cytochrome b [Hydrogenophaga sp. PAMC20947]